MWRIWLLEHGRWLAAGVGLMVAGSGLARFWWFEFGMALVLLGAAALGCLVGLARSAVLDAALTERIDRQLDELREEQRQAREAEWRSDGVPPIEKRWRALARRSGAAGQESATAPAPASANDVDRRLADLIRQRCDRVWSGIREKRDDAEPEVHARDGVRFLRRQGVLSDDLVVLCGSDRLTVAGPVAGIFARFFGPVLREYRLDAGALEIE
ncbi:MAG: hypothetical protein OXG72_13735 [Acidobacteria bacterium]|nr:hypothetical protein [Acidobacteriota bacterium]